MLIFIDTDTHSDTNDIICYMIVFWELNSYWGNFKIFLHGEWNEKIWIIMWTYFLHRFCTGLKWKIQFWNFGSLCDHYEMKNTLTLLFLFHVWLGWHRFHELFGTSFLIRLIYWYWAWKPNFFIIKKIVFF